MLRLKNSLLLNEEFTAVLRKLSGYKIPVSAGLKLIRLYKAFEQERPLILEARDNLIRNYGKDDGKGIISVPTWDAEVMREFGREYNELMDAEFESPLAGKISLEAFIGDGEGRELCLNLNELTLLAHIVDFGKLPSAEESLSTSASTIP